MVLVGMYLLVSDTVVVVAVAMVGVAWRWSFLDSLTFEPPPPPVSCCGGTGEGALVSRVLSGVLRASSISSCALVMERWVPYMYIHVCVYNYAYNIINFTYYNKMYSPGL